MERLNLQQIAALAFAGILAWLLFWALTFKWASWGRSIPRRLESTAGPAGQLATWGCLMIGGGLVAGAWLLDRQHEMTEHQPLLWLGLVAAAGLTAVSGALKVIDALKVVAGGLVGPPPDRSLDHVRDDYAYGENAPATPGQADEALRGKGSPGNFEFED